LPEFVLTEQDFIRIKTCMAHVGDVKTFIWFPGDDPTGRRS
jgi:hypothetical protein